MAEELTIQQRQAVEDRGGKLLVSAAAGSGKTKVLVDRLLSYIMDPVSPANIDEFLIITYTKAAAAELRVKIASKLSEKIREAPENRHLQQQLQRLYLTKISTVHAFCTELLREYAYRLDISGDFRVAEENECLELQLRVIEQVLDAAYENAGADADFRTFVDTQGLGRDDRQIPVILMDVFKAARCHLDPEGWLRWCLSVNDVSQCTDASETVWGKYLIDDLRSYLQLQIGTLRKCADLADASENMPKPAANLRDIVFQLERLYQCQSWDEIIHNMLIDYGRLTFPRKDYDTDLAERIKAVRNACKDGLAKKLSKFTDSSRQILKDLSEIATSVRGLIALTEKFMDGYNRLKKSKHVLDFGDLEHIALDLLLGKRRSGPTAIAAEVGSRYREVMVDEYQDSNAVQDAIFTAITGKKQNCFMVGDVKQSIYGFRLADPGIFLEKYHAYAPADQAQEGEGRKVLLSKNFRSATAVIEAVNHVFEGCMSEKVGGLQYGKDEALEEGIEHTAIEEPETELHVVQVRENAYYEEADYVAAQILRLLDGKHMIRQKDGLRPIRPEDIVILLRSPGSVGGYFASALERCGIRCSFGGSVNILLTEEVQTLRAILQAMDNPLQDIPLVAALTSRVFAFTADDLARIRGGHKKGRVYDALLADSDPKTTEFLGIFETLRKEARMSDLSRLIRCVFAETKIDCVFGAMPDGYIRMENLQTFCRLASGFDSGDAKNLSRFLKYLEALDVKGIAGAVDGSVAGAVTIMSIHKSKGLEFPVVFLSALSRDFNKESLRAQILCDRELGLGLSCVDAVNRVRYPSLAKRAIAAKMNAENISEEMRVLYVAMTRPKDRLIMTYTAEKPEKLLGEMVQRMDVSDPVLMTGEANCPGKWVLFSALRRTEAGALFALGGYPQRTGLYGMPWKITVGEAPMLATAETTEAKRSHTGLTEENVKRLNRALSFRYSYAPSTKVPSKQTATQLKGRQKDMEVAENTVKKEFTHNLRVPSFIEAKDTAVAYGTAMHGAMQHISYDDCQTAESVRMELQRLVRENYLTEEMCRKLDPKAIAAFFASPMGIRLRNAECVLREVKFSVLTEAGAYYEGVEGEKLLLQGVVDCAIVEEDGIVVIDFKTDKICDNDPEPVVDRYRAQVKAYANALSRIYEKPIKEAYLYFFSKALLYPIPL